MPFNQDLSTETNAISVTVDDVLPSTLKDVKSLPTFKRTDTLQPTLSQREVDKTPSANASLDSSELPLLSLFLQSHAELSSYKSGDANIQVDGQHLTIPAINFVARYSQLVSSSQGRSRIQLSADPSLHEDLQRSRQVIDRKLAQNKSIYGVSTGFGGSADTRTKEFEKLGLALLQHQHAGVLPPKNPQHEGERASPLTDPYSTLTMPLSIVRGAMLVRANSLARGHSAVRAELIDGNYATDENGNKVKGASLLTLLQNDLIPLIPLRGSISASGDLSPLSYIAGALIGERSIRVSVPKNFISASSITSVDLTSERQIISAPDALKHANLRPLTLQPKEHLGILNGTAFSASAAALCVYEASVLGVLSEALTAFGTEALLGCAGNYARFINEVRPHPGQKEVGETIRRMLKGSSLVAPDHSELPADDDEELSIDKDAGILRQDRYPLRTAPQFLGPQFEEVVRAWNTINIEINSTTDNPLIQPSNGHVHHGGNFQAMSVTAVLDPLRLALAHMGRLLFAQSTELTNSAMSRGLSANLCSTDASLNFFGKGLDIAVASYSSELGFLASNVGTHVRSAEMGNQAVNSLALISARYTLQALDVLSILSATYLYLLCQAVDLRALNRELREETSKLVRVALRQAFPGLYRSEQDSVLDEDGEEQLHELEAAVDEAVWAFIEANPNMDVSPRMKKAATEGSGAIATWFTSDAGRSLERLQLLDDERRNRNERSSTPDLVMETDSSAATSPSIVSPPVVNTSLPSSATSSRSPSSVRPDSDGVENRVARIGKHVRKLNKDLSQLNALPRFSAILAESLESALTRLRKAYILGEKGPAPASSLLGAGTRVLYDFVRKDLGVPMHGKENLTGFTAGFEADSGKIGIGEEEENIGERVSRIYEAIRDGRMEAALVKAVTA